MNNNRSHNFNLWQVATQIHPAQLNAALVLALICLIPLALFAVQAVSAAGGGGGGGITHLMM